MLAVQRESLPWGHGKQDSEDPFFWRLAWCSVALALLLSISFLLYQSQTTPATYDDQMLLRDIDNAAVVDVTVLVNQTENGI